MNGNKRRAFNALFFFNKNIIKIYLINVLKEF